MPLGANVKPEKSSITPLGAKHSAIFGSGGVDKPMSFGGRDLNLLCRDPGALAPYVSNIPLGGAYEFLCFFVVVVVAFCVFVCGGAWGEKGGAPKKSTQQSIRPPFIEHKRTVRVPIAPCI